MGLRPTPYVVPLMLGGALLAWVAGTIAYRKATRHWPAYAVLLLGASLWCVAYAVEISSTRLQTALMLARIEYIGIGMIAVCLPVCALVYTGRERYVNRRNLILLGIIPSLTVLAVFTNDLHRLFWTSYGNNPAAPFYALVLGHGPLYWLNIMFVYGATLFVAISLYAMYRRSRGMLRLNLGAMLLAAVIPLIAHFVHLLDLGPTPTVELSPLTFGLSGLLLAWGVFRRHLFEVIPIARHTVVEGLVEGMIVVDMMGRVVDINPAAERLVNVARSQAIGSAALPLRLVSTAVLQSTDPVTEPLDLQAGASEQHCEVTVSPLYSTESRLIGRLLILRDVTEQRRIEEQLCNSRKMEAIGQLAGGVAHEFNNQLQIINGYAEFILSQLDAESAIREDVEVIHRAGLHSAQLTQQLLAFSRLQPLNVRRLDLNALVGDLRKTLRPIVGEEATLELQLAQQLDAVLADSNQITQVLINLIKNAHDAIVDAREQGSLAGPGTITITTEELTVGPDYTHTHPGLVPGRYIMLSVSDNGIGMSPDVLQHLFEPFFTTKRVGRGTGLGLAAVYGIIKQSSGYIYADPLTQGTAMRILLPPAAGPVSDAAERPHDRPELRGTAAVLVIDDRDEVCAIASQMLDRLGYAAVCANSAARALEAMRTTEHPFSLLLSDVTLGDGIAHALTEELRSAQAERWPDEPLRVLYMTGYAPETLFDRGSLNPADIYVQKPFTSEQLALAVQRTLAAPPVI
ncbi:MAG: PAS domain-containing protein [Chloroflexi bacterium]|nr:PAS domain-containing protein [Chloroflexota bacterium]